MVLREISQYLSSTSVPHIPVILISRITIVGGHMIKSFIYTHILVLEYH